MIGPSFGNQVDLLKWREAQALLLREGIEVGIEANIDNQSKIVIEYIQ